MKDIPAFLKKKNSRLELMYTFSAMKSHSKKEVVH